MLPLARFSTNTERTMLVGLGNPGKKYVNSRHNVGFEMIESVASYFDIKIKKSKCNALIGEGKIKDKNVVLVKPQTYMNLSGESVGALAKFYKINPEKIIVIYDDIALDVAKLRIRANGSAGGHNGMKNIISHLNTDNFPRVRIGVGKPDCDLVDYVLQDFSKSETKQLIEVAKIIPQIVADLLTEGITYSMNKYN